MFYVYLIISVLTALVQGLIGEFSLWLLVTALSTFISLYLLSFALLLIPIFFINLNSPPEKFSGYFRFLIKELLPIVVFLAGVRIETKGLQKVEKGKKIFFVCNHQHDFDPVIMLNLFPDNNIAPIGKKEICTEKRYIAKAMHKLGGLFIDRENNRKAAETIVNAAKILKEKKNSVLLFPEGYTSRTCELLPFRNGAFKVAYKAQADIAVCVINNTRQIPKNILRRKTVVKFNVLEVLAYEDYKDLSTVELGDKLYEKMNNELQVLRKNP